MLPCICSVIDHSGKNNKVAHETQTSNSRMFLPHFDAFCNLSITEQTNCNMESVCFIQWSEKKKKHKLMPRSAWLFEDLCTCQLKHFRSHKRFFLSMLPIFRYLTHKRVKRWGQLCWKTITGEVSRVSKGTSRNCRTLEEGTKAWRSS